MTKPKPYIPDISLHLWYGKHGSWDGDRFLGPDRCRTCGAPLGTRYRFPEDKPNREMVAFMVAHHYRHTPHWDWLRDGMVGDPPKLRWYRT